jgi:hypothetical protein
MSNGRLFKKVLVTLASEEHWTPTLEVPLTLELKELPLTPAALMPTLKVSTKEDQQGIIIYPNLP